MNEVLPYLGYLLAVAFAFYAFVCKKQLLDLRALLSDAATKGQQQRERLKQADQLVQGAQKQAALTQDQLRKLERKLAEARLKAHQAEKAQEEASRNGQDEAARLSRQLDHWREQNQVLTEQLSEAVREKKQIQEQAIALEKNLEKQTNAKTQQLEQKLSDSQDEYKKLRSELKRSHHRLEKLQAILKQVNPAETKRLRARLSRTEQLFKSMKGLRELAEERNQNWESAIRLMAGHILRQAKVDHKAPIGPILGKALERIGVSLEEHAPEAFSPEARSHGENSRSLAQASGSTRPKDAITETAP